MARLEWLSGSGTIHVDAAVHRMLAAAKRASLGPLQQKAAPGDGGYHGGLSTPQDCPSSGTSLERCRRGAAWDVAASCSQPAAGVSA